jgi:hypothetical protein
MLSKSKPLRSRPRGGGSPGESPDNQLYYIVTN